MPIFTFMVSVTFTVSVLYKFHKNMLLVFDLLRILNAFGIDSLDHRRKQHLLPSFTIRQCRRRGCLLEKNPRLHEYLCSLGIQSMSFHDFWWKKMIRRSLHASSVISWRLPIMTHKQIKINLIFYPRQVLEYEWFYIYTKFTGVTTAVDTNFV
jgi:hypothetical protein